VDICVEYLKLLSTPKTAHSILCFVIGTQVEVIVCDSAGLLSFALGMEITESSPEVREPF
jgi:hypothetical protein